MTTILPSENTFPRWDLGNSLLDAIERDRRHAGMLELDAAQQFREIGLDVRRHSGATALAAAEDAEARIAEVSQLALSRARQPRTRAWVEEALGKRSQLLRDEIAAHVARNLGEDDSQLPSQRFSFSFSQQEPEAAAAMGSPAAGALASPVARAPYAQSTPDENPLASLRRDPRLIAIEDEYQVADEDTEYWRLELRPFGVNLGTIYRYDEPLTRTQVRLLNNLYEKYGYAGLSKFEQVRTFAAKMTTHKVGVMTDQQMPAYVKAWIRKTYKKEQWPTQEGLYKTNDNHNDAFRHAYWSALMTRVFGEEFADAFATAHEGDRGNQRIREAMDLYNNEVGRRIALQNPGLNGRQLADRVREALDKGELVVLDRRGDLEWSNKVRWLETGFADIDHPKIGAARPRRAKFANPDAQPIMRR